MKRFSLLFVILLAVVSLVMSDPINTGNENYVKETDDADEENTFDGIIKSPNNPRSYRALKLQNELKVVLIHDPETDKAAACMSVGVGSIDDDDELPGLAHLLEHMLFSSSEKYREKNSFDKFITEHAGQFNGSTGYNSQNYYFDVAHDHLPKTLDIFAQFFLAPLMDSSCTDKEVNAINSEHVMSFLKDAWRIQQVQRALSKPGHLHRRYNIGNLQSLGTDPKKRGINVRQKLMELYSTRYSSNLMYLAVLGRENLDRLEEMVVPLFEKIENKKLERSIYTEHFWGPDQLKYKIHITTIADTRRLSLRFPMPSDVEHYKTAPLKYISFLIGHEGPGSIANELRDRDWCEGLYTGFEYVPGFIFFYIDIYITKEAMDHIDEIVKLVFQYIYLSKKGGVPKWYFDEVNAIHGTSFKYEDKSSPFDHVKNVSEAMMNYPLEDILSYSRLHNQWNPDLISAFVNYLTPENMNKSLGNVDGEILIEPWYGTKYIVEKLSDAFITKMWKITEPYDKLHLPAYNEFLTTDFRFYPLDKNVSAHQSTLWGYPNIEASLNKTNITFLPRSFCEDEDSPIVCFTPEKTAMADMFVSLFNQSFKKYGYAAFEAELNYRVRLRNCGLEVAVFGYHEKLPRLLEKILREMINYRPDAKKFEMVKESRLRKLRNMDTDQPIQHGRMYLSHLLTPSSEHVYHRYESLAITKSVQIDDMTKFVRHIFLRVFIQGLIYGNYDKKSAEDIIRMTETYFQSASIVLPQEIELTRAVKLDDGSNFVYEAPHKYSTSSSYLACFQIDYDYPVINIVLIDLFTEFAKEKAFKVLRTEEQLGYRVTCESMRQNGAVYFLIGLQSERHPVYLKSRVGVFLEHLKRLMENMTEDDFKTYKESLKNRYLKKIVNQYDRAVYFLQEITDRRYLFDKSNVMARLVDPLKMENILEFFEMYIQKSGENRKKLETHVISNLTNTELPDDMRSEMRTLENVTKIVDANLFRSSQGTFPVPMPLVDIDTQN